MTEREKFLIKMIMQTQFNQIMLKFLLSIFIAIFFLPHSFAQDIQRSEHHDFTIVTIAEGLERPWGLAFLPNGDLLVTERIGQLRIIRQGKLDPNPIKGLPENIYAAGQGGLLDVALHPDFESNQLVYISFSGLNQEGAGTEVARGRFTGDALENVEIIFVAQPKTKGKLHYGSRLTFAADGTLFITTGDRYTFLHEAQNPRNHLGAIIRINDDGSIPEDNPFSTHKSYQAEIYSYGHRNVQGITMRQSDQSIWSHEHGPRGGDEVNKLTAGANYGWPAITYGIDYSGAIISDKTHAPGMEQPIVYWDPSIAPCGMSFYTGEKFSRWQGDLFVGALAQKHLRRLHMQGDKVIAQEVLLEGMARIRDVRNSPDGYLYILTDDTNGKVIKLAPVTSSQ